MPNSPLWQDKTHPLWLLLGILIVGGLGLAYCAVAYANGIDLLKDGTLVAIISGLAALWGRFSASSNVNN